MDTLLDDSVFFAPFTPFFDPRFAVDADGDLSAVDVLEVPLSAGVRVVVSRCRTRSPGGGSAGSVWSSRCRIRPR